VQKKPLRQRWHVCPCGSPPNGTTTRAYLARFVNPDTSVLKARQAALAWRRGEPLVQAANPHATLNQRTSGRQPLSSFGQPPVDPSETCVGGTKVGQPTRDEPECCSCAATHGESPEKAAVMLLEPPV
jgi:hypothetical protein